MAYYMGWRMGMAVIEYGFDCVDAVMASEEAAKPIVERELSMSFHRLTQAAIDLFRYTPEVDQKQDGDAFILFL